MAITVTTLGSLDLTTGSKPYGELVTDGSGHFFGTTSTGGAGGSGTVFELTASTGQFTILHAFTGTNGDGGAPKASLTIDASGNLFGTTSQGGASGSGANGSGTVFAEAVTAGAYTYGKVADLSLDTTGNRPLSGVYLAPNGSIIGTTPVGGANGTGSVYTLAPFNSTPTAVSFPAGPTNTSAGPETYSAPVLVGSSLFGTTIGDGGLFPNLSSPGTIYAYNPQTSTIATVGTFSQASGYGPTAGVVADSSGNLYGTTRGGGANNVGTIYEYNATTHTINALASFGGATATDKFSYGNLLRDAAGDLFGTTSLGTGGTVFELKAGATAITVLYSFNGSPVGGSPRGGLIADAAGDLYGMTYTGGANGNGTVYEIQGTDFVTECFVTGTRIRTVRGDVAVEALVVGDLVVTASGATRPIRWLGHRQVACRDGARAADVMPVRVAAHAFGEGRPARDLFLSPGHPVLVGADDDNVGGHLVPIMCLVNGTTVRRVAVNEVTYWHVELDAHDILLAEGLAAESYLDWGDRAFFSEASDHALANPDFVVPGLNGRCRPVATDGPIVEAERRRLDRVFAGRLVTACGWPQAEAAWA